MLLFANRPDPVFTAILHEALEDLHEQLTDPQTDPSDAEEIWKAEYPCASECFSLPMAVYTVDRLLAASKDPTTVYRLTDYHWLLLYDCLRTFCALHNDYTRESSDDTCPVGPYKIGAIDHGEIVDHYFWDTDFLVDDTTVNGLGPEGRAVMGLSDEAFGIAQKLPPHAHEMQFEVVTVPEWGEEPLVEGPYELRIPTYPGEYAPPDL
jgi:hypothetical protein